MNLHCVILKSKRVQITFKIGAIWMQYIYKVLYIRFHLFLLVEFRISEIFLIFKSTTEGRLYILNSALYQWRPLCFHCLVSLVVALSGLPTLRPALSSRQFNRTALFMLVGFSTGNGFPQWASLFHQVSHFSLCSAGPPSRSHPLPLTLIS